MSRIQQHGCVLLAVWGMVAWSGCSGSQPAQPAVQPNVEAPSLAPSSLPTIEAPMPSDVSYDTSEAAASAEPLPTEGGEALAANFCLRICPVKVGGVTCGTECQLSKGHSGKHMCVKLHDF